MHFREDREEVAVERSRIGHSRVAQQKRKNRSQRDPQHHQRHEMSGAHPIKFFHEQTRDERRVLRLPPWNHAQQTRLHRQIQNRDPQNRKKNASRDILLRLANLAPEMANVVVAPVAVDRIDHRRAQSRTTTTKDETRPAENRKPVSDRSAGYLPRSARASSRRPASTAKSRFSRWS